MNRVDKILIWIVAVLLTIAIACYAMALVTALTS